MPRLSPSSGKRCHRRLLRDSAPRLRCPARAALISATWTRQSCTLWLIRQRRRAKPSSREIRSGSARLARLWHSVDAPRCLTFCVTNSSVFLRGPVQKISVVFGRVFPFASLASTSAQRSSSFTEQFIDRERLVFKSSFENEHCLGLYEIAKRETKGVVTAVTPISTSREDKKEEKTRQVLNRRLPC